MSGGLSSPRHMLHVKRAHAELIGEIEGLEEEVSAAKRELGTKAWPKSKAEVQEKIKQLEQERGNQLEAARALELLLSENTSRCERASNR